MSKLDMELMGECATWLSIVSQLFNSRMIKLLEPHNITLGQFSILNHIVRAEITSGQRISDISKAVEVGQPAVTKAIAKFENMGLVGLKDSENDKRAKKVIAKPAATELLTKIRMSMGPDLYQAFSAIEDSNIERFAKDLKTLGKWLDENRLTS